MKKVSTNCKNCNENLTKYDEVKRIIRRENGRVEIIKMERFKCAICGNIHRDIPSVILPYKHYSADIIRRVVNKTIDCTTIGYEDYPCEVTMKRWIKEYEETL